MRLPIFPLVESSIQSTDRRVARQAPNRFGVVEKVYRNTKPPEGGLCIASADRPGKRSTGCLRSWRASDLLGERYPRLRAQGTPHEKYTTRK